jgi:hypothetical protein
MQVTGLHFAENKRDVPVAVIMVSCSKNSVEINQEPQRLFFPAALFFCCEVHSLAISLVHSRIAL